MSKPVTTTRKFDITVFGMQKNQQILFVLLCFPLSLSFIIGCLAFGPDIGYKIAFAVGIVEGIFFIAVARSPEHLYHFECTLRFLLSIKNGDDYIFKHEEPKGNTLFNFFVVKNMLKKIRRLTNIKKIHSDGTIEYVHSRESPHNFGKIAKLETFQPDDYQKFADQVERMILGFEDKVVIKTSMKVRSNLTDYAAPLREELKKDRVPQIVRESMWEHQQICEAADEKSYTNHMLILINYTPNAKKARHKLNTMANSVGDILKDMKIGYKVLDSKDKVLEMFYEDLTYNVHGLDTMKINKDGGELNGKTSKVL